MKLHRWTGHSINRQVLLREDAEGALCANSVLCVGESRGLHDASVDSLYANLT